MSEEEGDTEFSLVMPFWIDTDAYSDRDRLLFCCGYEFQTIYKALQDPTFVGTTIHRENESRVRMMAGKLGRKVTVEACEAENDPDGSWSYLTVEPK